MPLLFSPDGSGKPVTLFYDAVRLATGAKAK
jgi:hypothetical protein